ncbi:MAG TPA: thioredoxin family protein [Vicinamibacterales bacterium]|nr:thioredoxin family protein [Vicinamibacterales bacterium]
MPHVIELFFADHCFACPEAREALRQFASSRPDVTVIERNIDDDAEYRRAAEYHLIATPAFVIDRVSVLYGVPKPEKLAAKIDAAEQVGLV